MTGGTEMLGIGMAEALAKPLDASRVKTRSAGGNRPALSYLETHDVIRAANEIFGFGQWGHEVVELRPLEPVNFEKDGKTGVCVGYVCTVRLTVAGCVPTSGVGFGDATEYQASALVTAHELAAKEAESDALKRALKNYGDQFGLALYDKQARTSGRVVAAAPPAAKPTASTGDRVASEKTSLADKLSVETIEVLIADLNGADVLTEAQVRDGMKQSYGTEISAELSQDQATELINRLSAKKMSASAVAA